MGQTEKSYNPSSVQPNRSANRDRFRTRAKRRRRQKTLTLIGCILAAAFIGIFALKPASAATKTLLQSFQLAKEPEAAAPVEQESESVVQFQSVNESPAGESAAFALRDANALSIVSWQGAKNCGDTFDVTLKGVEEGKPVTFSTTNCTIFPQTGTADGTYTITVTGSGAYSLTAMANGGNAEAMRDTRTGVAGKADQMPLSVSGWGGAQDYYDSFKISVQGGSTSGAVTFLTDGCTVSPEVGAPGTEFEVTVTRVGGYELTAVMDGSRDFNSVSSARMSGCSSKSNQSPIHIDGWVEESSCTDTFICKIYGGSTSEALTIEPMGCEVAKLSSDEYEIKVTSVGPYAITATRAGNYGYFTSSAFASGIATKSSSPALSVSGWSDSRCCNDSFPIRVGGGVTGANISFLASGCTVSPATGTTETQFTVTVTSAGGYSLSAIMDGTEHYESSNTRTYTGQSLKGPQGALRVEGWIDCAPAGSSFEVTVAGGNGTGATSITTDEGCTARLKSGETNVYVISVYPLAKTGYSVTVGKAGDASYEAASEQTVVGTTMGANQTVLSVAGWSENVHSGDTFDIKLAGGSGTGAISFEPDGCKITPSSGGLNDTFTVTVTARENEKYTLKINRAGDENYAETSIQQSGSVKPFEKSATETLLKPVTVGTFSWVYICGGIVLLFAIVLLMMQFNASSKRRRHHK